MVCAYEWRLTVVTADLLFGRLREAALILSACSLGSSGAPSLTRSIALPSSGYERAMARRYWSKKVTQTSNALDLERDVFAKDDPKAIARSLKRSAERSRRRKSDPYRSAMSMLTFYINRAGKNLPKKRLKVLERAKDELRAEFGRV